MAAKRAVSKRTANTLDAGSTPAAASHFPENPQPVILVMPLWWWEIAADTWLSFRLDGETVDASDLKSDDPGS